MPRLLAIVIAWSLSLSLWSGAALAQAPAADMFNKWEWNCRPAAKPEDEVCTVLGTADNALPRFIVYRIVVEKTGGERPKISLAGNPAITAAEIGTAKAIALRCQTGDCVLPGDGAAGLDRQMADGKWLTVSMETIRGPVLIRMDLSGYRAAIDTLRAVGHKW